MSVQQPTPTIVIAGEEALATLRQGLTGALAFELLVQALGRLLIQLAVGVGKTEWMIEIIRHGLQHAREYDLIVVLLPRWDILNEVWRRLPNDIKPTVLRPRPAKRCGDLDEEWQQLERHACGHLGRKQLCGVCPRRSGCFWPGQYRGRLRGTRLILATQQHLVNNPHFIDHLRNLTGAKRPLVLIDESDLLLRPCDRTISQIALANFAGAQESVVNNTTTPTNSMITWLATSQLIMHVGDVDLREGEWRFPWVAEDWSVNVQRRGREMYGPDFRFIAYELRHFGRSDPASRERRPDGGLRFAVPPYLGKDFIVFSGSLAPELARYRLDPNHTQSEMSSPFQHHRFEHPESRWFNITMSAGAASYFPGNAPVILDFFASLVARNIASGKRTLLVARKRFRQLCQVYLKTRLAELTAGNVKIVTSNWERHDLTDRRTVALINYGVSGVNRFQHVECAYCLTGYYIPASALTAAVQDIDPTADWFPLNIQCSGNPPRRRVNVQLPDDRLTILRWIASESLLQKEGDVVVQAVGRVRPFTRPREVITFHMGELPGVRFDGEFGTLAEARAFFGVLPPSEADLLSRREEAARLRALGHTNKAIAEMMSVSLSSVKRYLRPRGGHGVL